MATNKYRSFRRSQLMIERDRLEDERQHHCIMGSTKYRTICASLTEIRAEIERLTNVQLEEWNAVRQVNAPARARKPAARRSRPS